MSIRGRLFCVWLSTHPSSRWCSIALSTCFNSLNENCAISLQFSVRLMNDCRVRESERNSFLFLACFFRILASHYETTRPTAKRQNTTSASSIKRILSGKEVFNMSEREKNILQRLLRPSQPAVAAAKYFFAKIISVLMRLRMAGKNSVFAFVDRAEERRARKGNSKKHFHDANGLRKAIQRARL